MSLLFPSTRKRRRTPRAILTSLNAKIKKKQRKIDKKREKIKIQNAIESARKKLRGY